MSSTRAPRRSTPSSRRAISAGPPGDRKPSPQTTCSRACMPSSYSPGSPGLSILIATAAPGSSVPAGPSRRAPLLRHCRRAQTVLHRRHASDRRGVRLALAEQAAVRPPARRYRHRAPGVQALRTLGHDADCQRGGLATPSLLPPLRRVRAPGPDRRSGRRDPQDLSRAVRCRR